MEHTLYYKSPVGFLRITADESAIIGVEFVASRRGAVTAPKTGGRANPAPTKTIKKCVAQLDEYFSGKRKIFDLPVKLNGTVFQTQVWKSLQKIPFGKTCSYAELAEKVKNPKACRAVGGANNKNKIAIIIPCHRVIGANGSLTGYAGGMDKKEWLLKHERP